jgi:hypothetical protein
MEVMAHLLRKAEQCRRLAAQFCDRNDPVVKNLLALADEFEVRAQRRGMQQQREGPGIE